MPLVIADRVRETTTTTGTGTITLTGPYTGFQAFSVIGNGNTTYYAIIDAATGAWEVGLGTYTLSGNTLSRDTVLSSSNGGAAVNFSAGTKDVIITQPAARAVYLDSATNATIPGITLSGGTANGVAYLNGSKVLTTGSALTFDGTTFANTNTVKSITEGVGFGNTNSGLVAQRSTNDSQIYIGYRTTPDAWVIGATYTSTGAYKPIAFAINDTEQMRLTSTGLGIGTSSPSYKLHTYSSASSTSAFFETSTTDAYIGIKNSTTASYIGVTSAGSMIFQTPGSSYATKLTIDSSGNLGLGVTPKPWASSIRVFQFGATGALTQDALNGVYVANNVYFDDADKYMVSAAASLYRQLSGAHAWFTAPSGTAGNAISFTQAMTLDASGNLMMGTTSPYALGSSIRTLTIVGDTTGRGGGWTLRTTDSSNVFSAWVADGASNIGTLTATPLVFQANNTERARIDSSGRMLVGKTSTNEAVQGIELVGPSGLLIVTRDGGDPLSLRRTTNDGAIASFRRDATLVGTISVTTSATAYNTSSDYRLKENIQPMTGALAKVAALKPCTYNWKADGSDGEGFIAHELQEVVPQCVTGGKDAVDAEGKPVYQGIDTSFLVATLTAAIQEQQAIIDSLKADVAALKGA